MEIVGELTATLESCACRCAVTQNQAIRAQAGSVQKTQETALTAPHLKDKTVSQLVANLRTGLAKKGKAEENDPCAHTSP